ncbi:hypothetical protein [Stagnihabitans tardus]|uniref:Lipoprotein n=1 Tax=Stagnihabitans tardus TaxID=2699202 RepID=A0AAE4Y846_9RHOB|nr:hypothetical protein [Stagnihabitans tardus]NBZ87661.1 hypothetical protein [Stagnihabitans tardus]
MKRLSLLLLLAACGPIPLADAERQCLDEARLAQQPRGQIAFGAGSGGLGGAFDVTISSDYLLGRDPDAVYASCVQSRAGQGPSRPFSSLPQSRM